MERDLSPENGGFPEPPAGGVVRVVRAQHEACGRATRVRLPVHLPAGAVRRVVCQGCARAFETPEVEEVELLDPAKGDGAPVEARRPGWHYLSIPVAAVAVIAGLMAIQGGGDEEPPFGAAVPTEVADGQRAGGPAAGGAKEGGGAANLVRESSFSLALPSGWKRTPAQDGATFAAATHAGHADATLWVERDPGLSLIEFEARSLDQLKALAGSARVVERVAAPTPEATILRLAADAPAGSPAYEVTLRSAGPYRYYLATTVEPGASAKATEGAELIHGSFVPSGATGKG